MSNNTTQTLSPQLQALSDAAGEAWLYSLPLIEIATTRARGAARGGKLNSIVHMPKLADHRARDVTTPNHDTLYSSAQLDLRAGPITLSLPVTGERYFSLALMDAYSNNFVVLGTRTTGPEGGLFELVGPDDAASGDHTIRAPTYQVWALGRILVDGPDDLAAARAMQLQLSVRGPVLEHEQQYANRSAPWQAYFASADALMLLNSPPVTDLAILRRMAPLGIGKGTFNADQFSAAQVTAIEQGISAARRSIRGSGIARAAVIDGWSYPCYELGDFGQAYAYRAGVAVGGLAALPVVEAMYMTAQGDNGPLFDGTQNWQLHFAAEQLIPVDSFWSLSLYEATQDGQFFFVDNSLKRYIISDRSAGLQYNDDGSLDIWIGAQHPGAGRQANWLPAPEGPFVLFMRAYLPQSRLLEGTYRLPPINPVA